MTFRDSGNRVARERADRCVESILAGHRIIIRESGNVHEEGLEDAVYSRGPLQGLVDAGDFIDDPFEYAAQAMERISTMHPFAEDNKRTAFFAALRILNWAEFTLPDTEGTYRFVLETSMGMHGVDEIRVWLRDNAVALSGKDDCRGPRLSP